MASNGNKPEDVLFRAGIRQDLAQQVAPAGTLIDAVNVRWRSNVGGIDGRPGNTALANTGHTGVVSSSDRIGVIATLGSAKLLGVSGALAAHSGSTFWAAGHYGAAKPVRKRNGITGPVPGGGSSSDGYITATPCCAMNARGDVLVASTSDSSVRRELTVFVESSAGVRLYTIAGIGSDVRKVQAVATGDAFVLIWQTGAALVCRVITPSDSGVSVSGDTTLTTLGAATWNWDTSGYDSTSWALACQASAGSTAVVKVTGATLGTAVTVTTTGTVYVSVWGDSTNDRIWLGWHDNPTVTGDVRYAVFTGSLVAISGPVTIASSPKYGPPLMGPPQRASGLSGATTALFFYRYVNTTGDYARSMVYGTIDSSGVVFSAKSIYGVIPISKPAAEGRIWAITATGDGTLDYFQRVMCLRFVDTSENSPVTELVAPLMPTMKTNSPEFTTGGRYGSQYFHAVGHGASSDVFAFPFVLDSDQDSTTFTRVAVNVYEYTTHDVDPYRQASATGAQLAVSGQPHEFFSRQGGGSEIGFPQYPIITSATTTGGGGGTLPTGVYKYKAVYEWPDMYGRIHQSAASEPVEVSHVGPDSISVNVTALNVSQRISSEILGKPQVVLYRTGAAGDSFTRCAALSAYDAADGIISFVDDASDSSIEDNATVYSEQDLENDLAPSCRFMRASETRLWVGGLFERNTIQASKLFLPTAQTAFVEDAAFQVVLNGDNTGLAMMDGTTVAFTPNSIQLVAGDGPDDRGFGEFAQPRTLSVEVGCPDGNDPSILETEIGVFFLSARGFYLIPRGFGAPAFIGEPVHLLTWQYSACKGAVFCSDGLYRLARFLMYSPADNAHIELIYDLDTRAWSYDTHPALAGAIGKWGDSRLLGFQDPKQTDPQALVAGEACGLIESPYTADSSPSLDWSATGITYSVRTADWRPFGLAGFGRAHHCTLVTSNPTGVDTTGCTVYTDGSATAKTWVQAASTGTDYRRVTPSGSTNQNCTSIAALVSVARPNSTGTRGPTIHGLVFEVTNQGGAVRVGDGKE